jgi:autotransporter-associated beta strand protein
MWKSASAKAAGGVVGILVLCSLASALTINGYTPAYYDRFSSGYPSAPIANTNGSFIGLGYDWSGVGWSATNDTQSFALLGSKFILYANHYTPDVGSTINFTTGDGTVYSNTVASVSGPLITGGDLAIAVLNSSVSSNITSYPILFLGYNTSINSPYYTAYSNLLLYGWTARIGWNQLTNICPPNTFYGDSGYYFKYPFDTTTTGRATLVAGDSGSPTFVVASTGQLCLVGDHYAVYNDGSGGVDSFLALELPYISAFMANYGYLPSVLTPPTTTWKSSSSTDWGNSGNWSGGAVPADAFFTSGKLKTCASVLFDAASTSQLTINLNGSQTVTGITFAAATGSNGFTIATGTSGYLTIGEAGIKNKDDDVQTLTCNIVLRNSQIWDVGQGGLLVTGSINTDTGDLLLIQGSGNAVLSGLISNSGGLAKDGLGTLTLSNSGNSYTGSTWIHAGTLALGNSNVIPDGSSVVVDGGTLALDGFSDVVNSITLQNGTISSTTGVLSSSSFDLRNGTITAKLGGAGTLTKSTSGTVVLSGSNSYTGGTTINGGALQFAASTALPASGNITINTGGTLQASGPYSLVGGTTGWLTSGRIVNTSAGTIALVQDEENINMAGYTSLSLGAIGNVTYTGTLTPVNNIYRLGGGGGTLTVNSNLVDGSSRSLVVGGGGSGGTVVLAGTGNTYSGGTTVSAGTLQLGNASALGSTLALTTVASGATLDVNGYTVTLGSLSGQGVVSLPGGKISIDANNSNTTFSGTISGSGQVEKIGSGTLLLSGSNTYSGITTISSGTLQIGGGGATGTLGTNSVVDNADLWFNRSDVITVSNIISGSGNLQQIGSGTIILTGANGYSGTTTVTSGVLQIGNGTAAGTLGTGAVTDNATLAFNRSDVILVSNLISGSGEVRQIGSGTLVLSGSNTYTGTTTVTNGILKLANSYALGTTAGGTIVQSGGALDLNGTTVGAESLTIFGTGSSGGGALTNSNTSTTAVYNGSVILGANASTGGSGNILISGSLNCGTYALTKIGSSVLSLTGSQIWGDNSTITVLAGTLSYQQTAIATTTVAASTPTLYIASGATVNVDASNNDPFTDDIASMQEVRIINESTGTFNVTAGTVSVAGISGTGDTTVTGGSILNSDYIYQSQLTIGAGSTVVINPISGSSSSLGLFTDNMPLSKGDLSLVPEPATWILIIIGVLCLLCRRKCK